MSRCRARKKSSGRAPTAPDRDSFYPIGCAGRRYPLVVQLHSGPMESDKFDRPGPGAIIPGAGREGYAVLRRIIAAAPATARRSCATSATALPQPGNRRPGRRRCLVKTGVADPERLIDGDQRRRHATHKLVTMTVFKAALATGVSG